LLVLGNFKQETPSESVILDITNLKKLISMSDVTLTAYNVKTKEKGVPIQDAVITKTAKGAYMAQGHDGKGNKLTTLLNGEKALAAIGNKTLRDKLLRL
jgi:hypothetical protein